MWRTLSVVVVGCLLVAADSPKNDLKKLEGTWVMVSGENEGNKIADADLKSCSLVVKGDKYTVKFGDETLLGTLKLNPSKTPKTIDSKRSEGDTLLGIYELKGNEFKVCLAAAGKDRPKDFSSGDYVHVWKRAGK